MADEHATFADPRSPTPRQFEQAVGRARIPTTRSRSGGPVRVGSALRTCPDRRRRGYSTMPAFAAGSSMRARSSRRGPMRTTPTAGAVPPDVPVWVTLTCTLLCMPMWRSLGLRRRGRAPRAVGPIDLQDVDLVEDGPSRSGSLYSGAVSHRWGPLPNPKVVGPLGREIDGCRCGLQDSSPPQHVIGATTDTSPDAPLSSAKQIHSGSRWASPTPSVADPHDDRTPAPADADAQVRQLHGVRTADSDEYEPVERPNRSQTIPVQPEARGVLVERLGEPVADAAVTAVLRCSTGATMVA